MDPSQIVAWSREAIRMSLMLGGPILLAALVIGLLVGIGQTLMQLNEPVVGQVPRLVVALVAGLAVLPWMIGVWVAYATELIRSLPDAFLP